MQFKKWTLKTFSVRILKFLAWVFASVAALVVAVALIIRIPAVQRALVQKVVAIIGEKIGTPISIKSIELGFPKSIFIRELYVQDQKHDTLLYVREADIGTDLWGLLHHELQLDHVSFTGLRAHITREAADSAYNFNFIVRKFSDTTAVSSEDTTTSPWKISLVDLDLKDTQVHFQDAFAGDYADARVGSLAVVMDEFDLSRNIYKAKSIALSNSIATLRQTKPPTSASPTSSTPLTVGLNEFSLEKINLTYTNEATGQLLHTAVGTAAVEARKVDLAHQIIDLDKVSVKNSLFSFQQMATATKPNPPITSHQTSEPAFSWHLKLKTLATAGNTINYYDYTQPVVKNAADYSHLWIRQLRLKGSDFVVDGNRYEGSLAAFSFIEKNGNGIQECRGRFAVDDRSASLQNFVLRTMRSNIAASAKIKAPSAGGLFKSWQLATVELTVQQSSLALQDILYFDPGLFTGVPLKIPRVTTVRFSGDANGQLNNISLHHVIIGVLEDTRVQLGGLIKNIPDTKHLRYELTIDTLATTKTDVLSVLPDSLVPKSIRFPEWLKGKGCFKGSLRQAFTTCLLKTDDGEADVNANIDLDSGNVGSYAADITLRRLRAGYLIRHDSLGTVSLTAHVRGSGQSLKNLNGRVNLDVSEFHYNSYPYDHIRINGTVENSLFSGTASVKDKNLDFDLTAGLDLRPETPLYRLKVTLNDADFGALHLTFRPIKARGTLEVKLATSDLKVLNGTVAIRNVAIFDGQQLYKVDSLLFASIDTKGQTEIKINSDIIDGSFQGTIHLVSLPDVLERHLNNYFALQDTAHDGSTDNQDFKFNLTLKKTDLITGVLFPSLTSFQASPITGSFNSAQKALLVHTEVQRLQYAGLSVQHFLLDISSTSRSLDCSLTLDDFHYDSLKVPGMKFTAKVAHDSIKSSLTILDSLQKQKYLLGTVFNSLKDEFQFRFIPGQVFLNYKEWKVPDDNYIRFHRQTITAHNFSIANEQEKIELVTKGDHDETVTLGFRQFDLQNIFNIVSGSNSILEGRVDGDLNVFLKKNNAFNAAVKILDLKIMQREWGELSLKAARVDEDKFDLTLTVKGEHADVLMEGNYVTTKPASLVHVTATLGRIDMALLEPFSRGQIKKATGEVSGKLTMTGTVARPVIQGDVNFKDVSFLSSYVNSTFTLKNETLKFDGTQLLLGNFRILDDNNNVATLKGSVQTKNFRSYILDLDLTTKNFRILNTTAANNDLYYGKVKMNATAKVTGPLSLPIVELRMGFSDDTEFTYVVPVSSKGVTSQKGIVFFEDKNPPKDKFLASVHLEDTTQNFIRGFDFAATVQLNDAQKFNIIIDPKSGDKLNVQGSTTLVIKIDPAGNMDLSGQYEISKGSYSFSFHKLVRRDFEILKGGTITWSGDPFDATFDLQALYKVETSPLELLATQATDLNPYRQAFPFLVYLNIKGQISTPEISFRLDMPEASKSVLGGNVYAAIQDINTREPELNKQVFSLLVLRRFMADDPFENQVTTNLSSNARSSVSGILTEQLNRLSQNIKGVQLTVDLKSFDNYTTGVPLNQTQLQLGVQKNLLHNKLVVKLAGNVDIAGENTNQNSLTDYIGDLALEYKVNHDGTLRLTGFRNSDYDMIDGELIRTGAGLIYIKDFNALKELFKKINARDQ